MNVKYTDCKRKSDKVSLLCKRCYIDDIPVCFSWAGDSDSPTEMCEFLGMRAFGIINVCMLTGNDIKRNTRGLTECPKWCKLHFNEDESIKEKDDSETTYKY